MAELVLERRAGLRSNGARIREVFRLKELQHNMNMTETTLDSFWLLQMKL